MDILAATVEVRQGARNARPSILRTMQSPVPPTANCAMADSPLLSLTYYGNTQARILDCYKTPNRTIRRRTNPSTSTYADAVCGRIDDEYGPVKLKRIATETKKLEKDQYTLESPATCITAEAEFKEYLPFKKLLDERKNAKDYTITTSTRERPVGFADLPAELKNRLYREWLMWQPIIPFQWERPITPERGQPWKPCGDFDLKLSVLRLNHQLGAEASSIFYGENSIHFTDQEAGWDNLLHWLERIGPRNTAYIRDLTVPIHWPEPWSGRWPVIEEEDLWIGIIAKKEAVQKCCDLLSKAGTLSTLSLRLPFGMDVHSITELPLDISKFKEGFKIKLVHICNGTGQTHPTQEPLILREGMTRDDEGALEMAEVKDPKAYAKLQGWEYDLYYCNPECSACEVHHYGPGGW